MGNSITVDKHTTNITDWIEVQNKLDQIEWNSTLQSNIKVWKYFQDSNHQFQINILPHQVDLRKNFSFSPNECYTICAINNHNRQINSQYIQNPYLRSTLHSIELNIVQQTYQRPIFSDLIQNNQCRIYCYIGKLSKPKMRLMATSYTLKFKNNVNSKKKLTILAGGGVLRNKKLQKGSMLPLFCQNIQTFDQKVKEKCAIDLYNLFQSNSSKNQISIFSYNPKIQIKQISNPENGIDIKKQQTKKQKTPLGGLKMNLKLDFTKNQEQSILCNKEAQKDLSHTHRSVQAKGKRQLCQQACSQIIEGLYVSGQKVAKNYQILKKHNIQVIINCAGDYCQNWHEDKSINYLTFFLKDSQNQNIQCLFYRVIDFIQNAHKNKQNVLVHCIQGISRSVSFVIAYIIFKYGYDYKKAQSFVKQKRVIACPNNGFMVELIQFHKRLYQDFDALPNPRVFLVSSHTKLTPHIITARMIKHPLFDNKKYIGLDSRGVYVIHTNDLVYIWVGSKCQQKKLSIYWQYANQFSKKLQKYQRAPIKVKAISQGTEGRQFFNLWSLEEPPGLYQNSQYNDLFIEGFIGKPGQQRQYYQQAQQQQIHTRLFIYPDYKQGLGIFSWEDLNGFCILVRISLQNNLVLHIWRNENWNQDNKDEEFLDQVIEYNYANYNEEKIIIKEQDGQNLSQQFTQCMSN